MWLIDTDTFLLVYHINCPKNSYAILSHTWNDGEEVSFQEFKNVSLAQRKGGFAKIEWTVREARRRGLKWAWVDTCCIDKTSSAELSEAINSMFQWYKNSNVCFAYLSDMDTKKAIAESFPSANAERVQKIQTTYFKASRWWSRGWTLQELIAPRNIVFYDQEWEFFGTKEELQDEITSITNITRNALMHRTSLNKYSVACRMSWAASRVTTRVEDTAYCLLGLFGLNMPLLYGEGKKAFIRLQEEICRQSPDTSIFAWTAQPPTEPSQKLQEYRGAFACHPSEFIGGDSIYFGGKNQWNNENDLAITNRGVCFDRPELMVTSEHGVAMRLWCFKRVVGYGSRSLLVSLTKIRDGFVRSKPDRLLLISDSKGGVISELAGNTTYIPIGRSDESSLILPRIAIKKVFSPIEAAALPRQYQGALFILPDHPVEILSLQPETIWDAPNRCFLAAYNRLFVAVILGVDKGSDPDQEPFILFCFTQSFGLDCEFVYTIVGEHDSDYCELATMIDTTKLGTTNGIAEMLVDLRQRLESCWDQDRSEYQPVTCPGLGGTLTAVGEVVTNPSYEAFGIRVSFEASAPAGELDDAVMRHG